MKSGHFVHRKNGTYFGYYAQFPPLQISMDLSNRQELCPFGSSTPLPPLDCESPVEIGSFKSDLLSHDVCIRKIFLNKFHFLHPERLSV